MRLGKYIDVHAHLNKDDYDIDRDEIYKRMNSEDVSVINIGTNNEDSIQAVDLYQKYGSFAIVGIHPIDVVADSDLFVIEKLVSEKGVVGIGECGLDYFRTDKILWSKQREIFEAQVDLAIRSKKPLMLHIRNGQGKDAYREVLDILKVKKYLDYLLGGNAHFYAGTMEEMKEFLDLGFHISFTGVITFTRDYDELVKAVPMDRILSETDSPFVSPVPFRGGRNEPKHVIQVVKRMAEIKGVSLNDMALNILRNAKDLFKLE